KKRSKDDDDQASEHLPRIKVTRIDEPLCMDLDFSNVYQQQQNISTPSPSSPCPSPLIPNYIPSQEENELNRFKMMSIDNIVDLTRENTSDTAANINLMATSTFKGVCSVAQNFGEFIPLIDKFIKLGEEVLLLYEKAKHNKELCGFLLNRCNCAMAAVRDLNIRKTENTEFFSKEENLRLFREFIRCMEKIRKFVSRISKLHKLLKYFAASNIEQDFNDLILEFDGYMRTLIEFSNRMDQLTMKNINFQTSARHAIEDSSEIEANEPLLDGTKYQRSYIHTKKIEKRTLYSSVGTLLWEIAELKKPHSDLNKADMLVSIRKRVSES
ncbi:12466_t:CDS:2, partial [Rhizophagus irregularis]